MPTDPTSISLADLVLRAATAGSSLSGSTIAARAEVRRPRGGDRVALEAQELLPAVLRAHDERERHGEEDDRHGRHGGDGEDEPAPHGRSKR